MQSDYDPEANTFYVHLSDRPYSHGRDLDAERRIDYAVDGTPIGIELTCVGSGVSIESLPAAHEVAKILRRLNVPIFA